MQAVKLFHSRQCRALLFTGGMNRKIGGNEAVMMAGLASSLGVDQSAILIDDSSSNTFENSIHSLRILENEVELKSMKAGAAVALISIHHHSRRAYETFARTFGASYRLTTSSYSSVHYSSANWFATEKGRSDVAEELGKLKRYLSIDVSTSLGSDAVLALQGLLDGRVSGSAHVASERFPGCHEHE